MNTAPAGACAVTTVVAVLGFLPPGYGQSPCKAVDATGAGLAARSADTVRDASPQALAAFRELSLNPPRPRIVGGHLTLISDNPWQIALIRSAMPEPTRSQFCGGSLIRKDWVLTAAHCVRNSIVREDAARLDIVVGSSQYAIGGERVKVAAIHTHPGYNQTTMDNDFALLRLQNATTKGQVVLTADEKTHLADGTEVCVTGWGATAEGGPGAIDLLGAEIPTVSTSTCNRPESYNGDILASMFCAGQQAGGVDSCQGDSGGPVSAAINGKATQVGVVSWGEGCARRLKYGVYARVSTAAEWITKTIGQ
jgi:transmembrane serine protease 11D